MLGDRALASPGEQQHRLASLGSPGLYLFDPPLLCEAWSTRCCRSGQDGELVTAREVQGAPNSTNQQLHALIQ